jgi:hypothetical protein
MHLYQNYDCDFLIFIYTNFVKFLIIQFKGPKTH